MPHVEDDLFFRKARIGSARPSYQRCGAEEEPFAAVGKPNRPVAADCPARRDSTVVPGGDDTLLVNAAVKLNTSAETSDVHPIVLRIPGDEPCVPIKLTRIAAVDDLRLRVAFLSEQRVVPDNYRHVILNDLKLDWINQGFNYDALVTQAVDAAGGQGWVTEYAGTSDIVEGTENLVGPSWDAGAFPQADPFEALESYAKTTEQARGIDLHHYTFPSTCMWFLAVTHFGADSGSLNNTVGAVTEMQRVAEPFGVALSLALCAGRLGATEGQVVGGAHLRRETFVVDVFRLGILVERVP